MSLKSFAAKIIAKRKYPKLLAANLDGVNVQNKTLASLISKAKETTFGKDHGFNTIGDAKDFRNQVPVRDYEKLKPYVDLIREGKSDVLWQGKPIYFAKTSGTTSGAKYIPITKESIVEHIEAAKNALFSYIYDSGKADFVNGKMIFLQGSPILNEENGIKVGRLSGIVAHYVPSYLQSNRLPSWAINCIDSWEDKVKAIAKETLAEDMRLISGIPPWVKMYYEELLALSKKPEVKDIFPHYELFVYGGVNFKPYKDALEKLVGKSLPSVELFPASEGFFAFQDKQNQEGMLLNVNAGMFFEFIPKEQVGKENPERIGLDAVEIGKDYALLVSSNAGLWAYDIGDVIRFTSLKPYRIIVSGRTKHFTSAFGEHVIATEVEKALTEAIAVENATVAEFSVAPLLNPEKGLPRHQWLIEFDEEPNSMSKFVSALDLALQKQNTYYQDLIQGKVLEPLEVISLKKDTFIQVMKADGKLGGQNKAPRLANDRTFAEKLVKSAKKSYRSSI